LQVAFDDLSYWGERNNPGAEAKCAELLATWRSTSLGPIFHIKHNSDTSTSPLVSVLLSHKLFREELAILFVTLHIDRMTVAVGCQRD
jgi:hypothetical protein